MNHFNSNLKYLREKNKLSVVQAAEKCKLSFANYRNYEYAGMTVCNIPVLQKKSGAYQITMHDLVFTDLSKAGKPALVNTK